MPPLLPTFPAHGPHRWPGFIVGVVIVLVGAGFASLALPVAARDIALNLLNATIFGAAGAAAFHRARREPEAAWGWNLLGLALAAQFLTQVWALHSLLRYGQPPAFPSLGEAFSFLSLGLTIAALLAWPLTSASGSERLRKGLDGLGIAAAVFFAAWVFALGPLFRDTAATPLNRAVMVGFFLGNATILGIGAYLCARQPSRLGGPLGWVMLTFGLSLLQVTIQVPLSLAGGYYVGHPLDMLVLLAGLGVLLAPLAPQAVQPGPAPDAETRDTSLGTLILPLVPSATAVPFALSVLFLAPERVDRPFLITGILMTTLGLLRGLLALRDLQLLSTLLEARVQERTRSLEAAQELLLKTERLNGVAILGAGLAHDLKNLLGVIRLRTDLLTARLGNREVEARQDVEGLREAAARAEALTADLMAFGRSSEDAPVAVDLALRVQQLRPLLRATLPAGIRFTVDLPPDPVFVLSQPGRLDQLIVNLVLNARDAMPDGGVLRLAVALEDRGSQAELTVSDTGVGIPEPLQARIFEPFFTTKAPGRGTGLGLASVHQTVVLLGGSLSLVSQPNQGTTFTLRFPACA